MPEVTGSGVDQGVVADSVAVGPASSRAVVSKLASASDLNSCCPTSNTQTD
jgi:hypothetical protein